MGRDDDASPMSGASEPLLLESPVPAPHAESPGVPAPDEIAPDEIAPPAAPLVEPAASTSAFAAALRRAQHAQAPPADPGGAHDRTAVAPADDASPPAPGRRPRRFGEGDAALEALPPRLREKMTQQTSVPPESNPILARILIAAALLIVVIVGAFLVQRFLLRGATPGPGVERAGAVSPDAEGAVSAADTDAPPVNAADAPAGAATPAPAADRPAAASPAGEAPESTPVSPSAESPAATAEPAAPAAGAPTFSLGVGTYLNEARARAEQARLTENTPYPARVATVQDDGVAMYHVTMGSFPTRAAAERAASDLISRGLVDEARVIRVLPAAR
jgi:hypothetical protein